MSRWTPGVGLRRALIGLAGTALGLGFLWLAFGRTELGVVARTLRAADLTAITVAVACYWVALALRVIRWRLLLQAVQPVGTKMVAEILVCGYAMNNLLPARLGEFFRADLAKRRLGLSRSTVLGSIVVERLLDLAAIVGCLGLGLLLHARGTDVALVLPLGKLLGQGAAVVGVVMAAVYGFWRYWHDRFALPTLVSRVLSNLQRGLATAQRRTLPPLLGLTLGVWGMETLALWWVFLAFGARLSTGAAMLSMGAASLSTLVPTAPAYLGSYQWVFAAVMPALGESPALGLAAATVIQLALFGSVTIAGMLLLAWRGVHNAASPRSDPVNADGREDPGPA